MKKLVCLLAVCALVLGCSGCGKKTAKPGSVSIDININTQNPNTDTVEDKDDEPVKQETVKPQEPAKQQEKPKENNENTIRPEFKASMESYESFFDEYVSFMKSYDGSLTSLLKYTEFMAKYADAMEKLDKIGNQEMSTAELKLYTDTMINIERKLLEVIQ